MPYDRLCIVDGKLATTVGPQYIDPAQRDVIAIDLTGHPLTSAKRVVQRESGGILFPQIILDPSRSRDLLTKFALIQARSDHDSKLRDTVRSDINYSVTHRHVIDSTRHSREEMVDLVASVDIEGDENIGVPKWEIEALDRTRKDLVISQAMFDDRIHPADANHFSFNLEGLKYKVERLNGILSRPAIDLMREDLRKTIADGWSSLMMKNSPRFFRDENGVVSIDNESQGWTPEYYKIAEAWPIFSSMLKDKIVLDPFAGAGTLTNLLATRNLPAKILTSDLSYDGGHPLESSGKFYAPDLNRKMWEILFDDLPSWYKPDHSRVGPAVAADVRSLPFEDKSIDYIVADPPYGKNCPGGLDLLQDALSEMKRVTREGNILLIPTEWLEALQASGHELEQLTRDVSRGKSGLPTCYVYIPTRKSNNRSYL